MSEEATVAPLPIFGQVGPPEPIPDEQAAREAPIEAEWPKPRLKLVNRKQLLISLWVLAYSEGVSSAREVARLCEYDPAYQWLTAMEVINYHTLSDFRVDHKEALDELFKEALWLSLPCRER